jgi:hypothetical protein
MPARTHCSSRCRCDGERRIGSMATSPSKAICETAPWSVSPVECPARQRNTWAPRLRSEQTARADGDSLTPIENWRDRTMFERPRRERRIGVQRGRHIDERNIWVNDRSRQTEQERITTIRTAFAIATADSADGWKVGWRSALEKSGRETA